MIRFFGQIFSLDSSTHLLEKDLRLTLNSGEKDENLLNSFLAPHFCFSSATCQKSLHVLKPVPDVLSVDLDRAQCIVGQKHNSRGVAKISSTDHKKLIFVDKENSYR